MPGFPDVGDVFGRYEITGRLGRGGMGVVFSAVQRGLDRTVALKVLSPELAPEPQFRTRFTREAAALASLDSPHIIHIYDHGEQDGCLFIATQMVTGGDLWDRLDKNGGYPPPQALDIVAQVSSALADAHAAQVIHRDIKPSNVLLHGSGDDDTFAYLCDFGIAKRNDETRTRTVGVIGTLGYMAPERHEGADASVSTDVYSLGCLLWVALMGKPPYEGSDIQVAIQHMRDPIPTYPGEDSASLAINAIVQRSMAKKPEDRFPTAAAMRADLVKVLHLLASPPPNEDTVLASPPPSVDTVAYVDPSIAMAVAAAADTELAPGGESEPQESDRPPPPTIPNKENAGIRRHPVLLLAGVAALTGAVLIGGASLWSLTNDDNPGTTPESSSNTGNKPVTCWNGQRVPKINRCTLPEGTEGLKWVYPSFKRDFSNCEKKTSPHAGKNEAWFCSFSADSEEGIRYSSWGSIPEAQTHYYNSYSDDGPEDFLIDGRRAGYLWRRTTPKPNGIYRMSALYENWPFSISVEARSPEERDRVFATIPFRPPDEIRGTISSENQS